jgi:hypothetical protein
MILISSISFSPTILYLRVLDFASELSLCTIIPFPKAALYIAFAFSYNYGASGDLISITARSMLPGVRWLCRRVAFLYRAKIKLYICSPFVNNALHRGQ